MGILKVIEWKDETQNTIVYKVPIGKDVINKGSALTVRESQVAVFCDKGKMADVFLPGFYKMDTNSLPIITKLLSWKYGFETPFKSDVYFVNTKQFTNHKWGTSNPIIVRDPDYGAIRIRGFGTYSFRVKDAYIFMQQLSGTSSSYRTQDISDYIRSIVVTGISDAIGESKLGVLDMAGNLLELSEIVRNGLNKKVEEMGIEVSAFNFENFSMPKELEDALDQNTKLGMLRKNMDVYTQMAGADAIREAAKNPGMAGTTMGAGMGVGMGMGMGNMFGNMFGKMNNDNNEKQSINTVAATEKVSMQICKFCGAKMSEGAKFCPECGKSCVLACVKCGCSIKEGTKFCPECGALQAAAEENEQRFCGECGAKLAAGAKFCPECGGKV